MYNKTKHQGWLSYVEKQYLGSGLLEPIVPTGCFVCGAQLPAGDDGMCSGCRRVSCGVCGACCCGRLEYEGGRKSGLVKPWAPSSLGRDVRRMKDLKGLEKIRAATTLAKSKLPEQ
jgi:hypothetical protein